MEDKLTSLAVDHQVFLPALALSQTRSRIWNFSHAPSLRLSHGTETLLRSPIHGGQRLLVPDQQSYVLGITQEIPNTQYIHQFAVVSNPPSKL